MNGFIFYFAAISVLAICFTVYDKKASKKPDKRRISENSLFLLAFMGGSIAEYLTMLKIRHKTKHKRFMIGLPVIIILQLALIIFLFVNYMDV